MLEIRLLCTVFVSVDCYRLVENHTWRIYCLSQEGKCPRHAPPARPGASGRPGPQPGWVGGAGKASPEQFIVAASPMSSFHEELSQTL